MWTLLIGVYSALSTFIVVMWVAVPGSPIDDSAVGYLSSKVVWTLIILSLLGFPFIFTSTNNSFWGMPGKLSSTISNVRGPPLPGVPVVVSIVEIGLSKL